MVLMGLLGRFLIQVSQCPSKILLIPNLLANIFSCINTWDIGHLGQITKKCLILGHYCGSG